MCQTVCSTTYLPATAAASLPPPQRPDPEHQVHGISGSFDAFIDVLRTVHTVLFEYLQRDRETLARLVLALEQLHIAHAVGGETLRKALAYGADSPLLSKLGPHRTVISSERELDAPTDEWAWHIWSASQSIFKATHYMPFFGGKELVCWEDATTYPVDVQRDHFQPLLSACLFRARDLWFADAPNRFFHARYSTLAGLERALHRFQLFHETRRIAVAFAHHLGVALPTFFQTREATTCAPLSLLPEGVVGQLSVDLQHLPGHFSLGLARENDPFTVLHIERFRGHAKITIDLATLTDESLLLERWNGHASLLPRLIVDIMNALDVSQVDVLCDEIPVAGAELAEQPLVLALFQAGFEPFLCLQNSRRGVVYERQYFLPEDDAEGWGFLYKIPDGKPFAPTHWRMWRLDRTRPEARIAAATLEGEPGILRPHTLPSFKRRESCPFQLIDAWKTVVETSTQSMGHHIL